MILIGQFDSFPTRRVGIALAHYGIPFERDTRSIFGDADAIVPRWEGDVEPLHAVYATRCLPAIEVHLTNGRHALRDFLGAVLRDWLHIDPASDARSRVPSALRRWAGEVLTGQPVGTPAMTMPAQVAMPSPAIHHAAI